MGGGYGGRYSLTSYGGSYGGMGAMWGGDG
jgi:hypothetical protein